MGNCNTLIVLIVSSTVKNKSEEENSLNFFIFFKNPNFIIHLIINCRSHTLQVDRTGKKNL